MSNLALLLGFVLILLVSAEQSINQPQKQPTKRPLKQSFDDYKIDYSVYHDYQSVNRKLFDYASHPYVSLYQFDEFTSDGHPLILVRFTDLSIDPPDDQLSNNQSSERKLKALLTFGEHPRELVTVESCLALLDELTAYQSESSSEQSNQPSFNVPTRYAQFIATHFDLHLVCTMNPSGLLIQERAYQLSKQPNKQVAKQTIKQSIKQAEPPFCRRWNGNGVDLNRNSAWRWGASKQKPNNEPNDQSIDHSTLYYNPSGIPSGGSARLGDEEYRGARPFSEVESQFIQSLSTLVDYTVYASIHSGEQQVFSPFVDSVSLERHYVRHDREKTDERLIDWLIDQSNGFIRSGGIGWKDNSYAADGTYYDWMAGVKNVPYTLCFEAWGDSSIIHSINQCFNQFNPAPNQLKEDLQKIYSFYHSLFEFVLKEERGVTFELWNKQPIDQSINQSIDQESVDLLDQLHQLEHALLEAASLLSNG